MRFWKKTKHHRKEKSFNVLDIGSDRIKVLSCMLQGGKVEILGKASRKQAWGEMETGTITDIAGVLERCHESLVESERMAGFSQAPIIVGVGGELVKGASSTIQYKRNQNQEQQQKIQKEELSNIINKISFRAFDKVRHELAYETGYNTMDIKLVHASLMDIKIDGYKVANPIGFQGKLMELSMFMAFSPLVHYGAIQTIVAELDRELIAIMAEPYALSKLFANPDTPAYDGIFIDIGGSTTDIAIVVDGVMQNNRMFHLGGRAFTKRLAQRLNISKEEAEEVKRAFSQQQLELHSNTLVTSSLQPDVDLWLAGLRYAIEECLPMENLPSTLYLSGGGSKLPLIKESLESKDWHKSIPFPRKPQVKWTNFKDLKHLHIQEKLELDMEDIPALALASLGLDLIHDEKMLTQMVQKSIRFLPT